ncbi:SGNH/GDSL hydrolase family protein [Ammoniphilus sp. YIM 78166]|uniref:SGNH/GDSL hydrolase family protein n=1 Tax=Ammoniphilus sp. YIM 78166 TaxID=1644106 RepID=UPI00106F8948|nr:SGNH/GDSL hydrolase family protein [Ammoniphilus sp. YIM 78166]
MKKKAFSFLSTVLAASLVFGVSVYAAPETQNAKPVKIEKEEKQHKEPIWIGAWAASQQHPRSTGISQQGFINQTVRMIVHPSASGSEIRLRFSNLYGTAPLTFGKVDVALASDGASTVAGTNQPVTFNGEPTVTIPIGAELFSDPIPLAIQEGESLAVSVFVPEATGPTTWHSLGRQAAYAAVGDHAADHDAGSYSKVAESWFWLSGVDVVTKNKKARVIVTFGDSITDGHGATVNANHRYPDFLAKRLAEAYPNQEISVLNAGISGNKILRDSDVFGEKALARLDRDVLSQTGVTDVILLEGINDIGHAPHTLDASLIIAGMKEIADRVHAKGLRIYAGTLLPFEDVTYEGYFTEEGERTRDKVNEWIRTSGVFDGVIDFDQVMLNPEYPDKLLPTYDSGDHLHPNDAGYQAMAESIDLTLFKPVGSIKQDQ